MSIVLATFADPWELVIKCLTSPWEARLRHHPSVSLVQLGRYTIRGDTIVRHWDLASGIGTALSGVLRSGLSYANGGFLAICEVNSEALGVTRYNLPEFRRRYPTTAPEALLMLPSDLFVLARQARDILSSLPDDKLPNYITSSVPCTESSKAGKGGAGHTEKGKLYLGVLAVIWAAEQEYQTRGLAVPGRASVGWIYETSPTSDRRPAIAELRSQLQILLGEPALVDQARTGGTSRRKTELYSNLGRSDTWSSMGESFWMMPEVPLTDLLRKGEMLQPWDERFHGPAEWPNQNGAVPLVWPKFVRSLGSHSFRDEPIRRRVNGVWESRLPIGVTVMQQADGSLAKVVPSAQQTERSLGFWADYTARSLSLEGSVEQLAPNTRRGMLGDVFGMHVHSAVLIDRMREAECLPAPRQPPQQPRRPQLSPSEEVKREQRQRHQQPSGQPQRLLPSEEQQRQYSQPQPQQQSGHEQQLQPPQQPEELHSGDPEEQEHSPAEELLGEEFASHDHKGVKPPHKNERLPPLATAVPDPWPIGAPEELKARHTLARALRWMKAREEGIIVPEATLQAEQLEWYVASQLLHDDKQFEPGYIHRFRVVWKEYLVTTLGQEECNNNKKVRAVFRLLDKGLEPNWAPPDRPDQEKHPLHDKRRASVKRMMCKLMPESEAEAKLSGPEPPVVHLPNLASCFDSTTYADGTTVCHRGFVEEQIQEYLGNGTMVRWPWPEGKPPHCVLPMGVVVKRLEKKCRLIFDARLINLWTKYVKFKYETMSDVLNLVFAGGWASVSDYKSGYSHIAAPALAAHLCVAWNGELLCFTCVPFGIAPACRVFTELNEVMLRPLRQSGIRISIYIDDRFSNALTEREENTNLLIQYAIMGACGWFVSIIKSMLAAAQLVKFTGLLIDLRLGLLTVPEKKLRFMLLQIDQALDDVRAIDARSLQSIAGRVGAARLAIRLAPMLCWSLHKEAPALVAEIQAGGVGAEEHLRGILSFIRAHLEQCNGSAFWQQPTGMVVAGDAGEMGSGSFLVWPADLGVPAMQTSFTAEQMSQIESHEYFSTRREVDNVLATLQWIVQSPRLLDLARRGVATYLTDSQSAHDAVMGLRTKSKQVFLAVWDIWALARQHNVGLRVRWCSREHPLLKGADAHTREPDADALGLKQKYFDQVLDKLHVRRDQVQLDPFSQAEFAKAPRWYSKYDAPGSAGVDGFTLPWVNPDGTKAFCFVNGPFQQMGQILEKIAFEMTDCILITPGWPKYWVALLKALPVVQTVEVQAESRDKKKGGGKEPLYFRGSRAFRGAAEATCYWKTYAHLVVFSH